MYNGLGPYYVDENESIPKQKIVLKRSHNWRDDYDFHRPKLDKIVLTLIADTNTAVMALEGEIDLICRYWNAPLDAFPKLEENPGGFRLTQEDFDYHRFFGTDIALMSISS